MTASGSRVGRKERVQRSDQPTSGLAAEREPPPDANEAVGLRSRAQRLSQQRPEVAEVPRDDHALLGGQGGEVDAVRPSPEVVALADGDHIVPAGAQLPGDLWRKMLVEQQPQEEIASWAARQLASSRSLSASLRAIQSSICARLAP